MEVELVTYSHWTERALHCHNGHEDRTRRSAGLTRHTLLSISVVEIDLGHVLDDTRILVQDNRPEDEYRHLMAYAST